MVIVSRLTFSTTYAIHFAQNHCLSSLSVAWCFEVAMRALFFLLHSIRCVKFNGSVKWLMCVRVLTITFILIVLSDRDVF